MSNRILIVLAGIILMAEALAAHADNAGPVQAPAVGTANPAPPAGAPDIGAQEPPKPVLDRNSSLKTDGTATDTSTAAPGGQAESSANGALSSPPNGQPVHQTHHRKKPAADANGEPPK